jgi:hypothetical protein
MMPSAAVPFNAGAFFYTDQGCYYAKGIINPAIQEGSLDMMAMVTAAPANGFHFSTARTQLTFKAFYGKGRDSRVVQATYNRFDYLLDVGETGIYCDGSALK